MPVRHVTESCTTAPSRALLLSDFRVVYGYPLIRGSSDGRTRRTGPSESSGVMDRVKMGTQVTSS
jgi:hypothetical protein